MRTLLLTALFVVPTASFAAPFSDVSDEHPNAEAIAYVKSEGIVEGYADGTFRPNATINRAEFLKMVREAQAAGWDGEGHVPQPSFPCFLHETKQEFVVQYGAFRDVDFDAWYADYLCPSVRSGIIAGYPDGTFRPANSINFVEAAKILVKAFDLETSATIPSCEGDCPWYREYVLMLEMKNAIPTSITGLDQAITRGEMAEMIYRLKTGNSDGASRTYEMLELRTETVMHGDVSFRITYPGWWGVLQQQEKMEEETFFVWSFDDLNTTPYNVYVIMSPDAVGDQFSSNRVTAGGMHINQSDSYSAESGTFDRGGSTFIGNTYVSLGGSTGIRYYLEEYGRREAAGGQPSVSEIVFEDIAGEDPRPLDTVFRLYPAETVAEQRFFAQVDAFIGSMR